MVRAARTATGLTGVTGAVQTIPAFTLNSGAAVPKYQTKPGADRVGNTNPLHEIWTKHATSDIVQITCWSAPTAQKMQRGKKKYKFWAAAGDCRTVGELRQCWEKQGRPWILEKFLFASRWVLFTIDTPAALADYARLKAAVEGRPAPMPTATPAVELLSEDEVDALAPLSPADESDDDAPPLPPLEEEDEDGLPPDDEESVVPPPPALLYGAGTDVLATDGKVQHPAKVVADCLAGAETCCIEWTTGRTGQHDWPVSAVMALDDLPSRRRQPRKNEEAPADPRRAKAPTAKKQPPPPPPPRKRPAPPSPARAAFRVGDRVMARYLRRMEGFYPGTVAGVNTDGSYAVDFDDCDEDRHVIAHHVRAPAAVVINERPLRRKGAAEKRTRLVPPPPPPQLEVSDDEVMAPPPPQPESDDEVMAPSPALDEDEDDGLAPPQPPSEGEEDEEDDAGATREIVVTFGASPGSITVTPPVVTPRAAPLPEGDDDSDAGAFGVGAAVDARFKGRDVWYPGEIVRVRSDGYDVLYEDGSGDREARVSLSLIRERFKVSAANDACGLDPGARVYAPFDGQGDHQDWWGGTIVDATEYFGQGEELHIVFDEGSEHRMWAHNVAWTLPQSVRATTLTVDRPNAKALALIKTLRRDPGAGRRRRAVEALDAATLWEPTHKRAPPGKLRSAELGSGKARLSFFLAQDGVLTTTVDWNPECGADDQRDFLALPLNYLHPFNIVHVSKKCFTYSNLAGSTHRTRDNPEGHSAAAARANRELAHLVAMVNDALRVDPEKVVLFENPVGMMQHTKGARLGLEKKLGLTRLEVCYCKFMSRGAKDNVKKPTHFWTNCQLLINAFRDGKFRCTARTSCSCGDGYHRRVRSEPGQGDRASDFAAFPDEVARFLALMLINEARARSR